MKDNPEEIVRLPLQIRRTEYGDGELQDSASVQCPLLGASTPLSHCEDCERRVCLTSVHGEAPGQWCRVPGASVKAEVAPLGLGDLLARTPVSAVMTSRVTCVDSELDLSQLARVFSRAKVHAAPVVEDGGLLLGMISTAALVRGPTPEELEEPAFPPDSIGVLVEDVMTLDVLSLEETASLVSAVHLMAQKGVHRLPVVSRDGVVVGILSVIDVMRWLARQTAA
jgi:CBS domain-containing protein